MRGTGAQSGRRLGAVLASALGLGLLLAACGPAPTPPVPPGPPQPAPPPVSAESAALASYFGQVQAQLLSQGLLRTDGGGADTPFTDRMLAENFLRIAFYEEYDRALGGTVRHEAPIPLTRWQAPVRVALEFGASLPADRQARDTGRVAAYLARLERLTGHPVSLAGSGAAGAPAGANFTLVIDDLDERRALTPQLSAQFPSLSPGQIATLTHMDRTTYCQVITLSDPGTSTYTAAVAVIPSELPDLMFMACLHEELAQALGLPNDSGLARPSIFNDDQEFALLTRQDELMLKMLYSPELRPGMTEAEARPLVETLASRLLGGDG
jgi:hypothetical protein